MDLTTLFLEQITHQVTRGTFSLVQLQIVDESEEMGPIREGDASSVRIIHDVDGGTKVVQVISQTPAKDEEQNVSTEEVPMEVGE